jgi:hypothetical protein
VSFGFELLSPDRLRALVPCPCHSPPPIRRSDVASEK